MRLRRIIWHRARSDAIHPNAAKIAEIAWQQTKLSHYLLHSQCQIIPIAAFVAHQVGVIPYRKRRAVREIDEGAGDRVRGGVADNGKDGASRERGGAEIVH